jgi:hypothetical protein
VADVLPVTTLVTATIQIREASQAELSAWDTLVRSFPNHRVVHTTAWIRSLEGSGFGHPLFLVFEKHGQVIGCLPGLVSEVGPFRLFGSPPPASRSVSMGPTFDPERATTAELMESAIAFLEGQMGVHHLEIMSPDLDPASMLGLGFRGEPWPTYRVPLFPGDEARTFQAFTESARCNVNLGIKLGLEVRLETGTRFVDEHYQQIKDVYLRGRHALNFRHQRLLQCFRWLTESGNLMAVSIHLPSEQASLATAMFTIEGKELLLWTWAHRTQDGWHAPTELMIWTVIKRALRQGCETFELMGLADLRSSFSPELDNRKYRWVRSRYRWLTGIRDLAVRGVQWQQVVRGRVARWGSSSLKVL